MTHFKNLLDEMKYLSIFDIRIDQNGKVLEFKSEFGDETLEDVQKMVNVLIRKKGITLNGKERNLDINIDDIGEDKYPYYVDIYHDIDDIESPREEDSVIPFTKRLLNQFLKG